MGTVKCFPSAAVSINIIYSLHKGSYNCFTSYIEATETFDLIRLHSFCFQGAAAQSIHKNSNELIAILSSNLNGSPFLLQKKIKKVIVTFYLASQTFFILCITIWALFPRNSEKKIIILRYILIIVSLYIMRSKFRILTFFLAILSLASLTFFRILSLHFTIRNISLNSEFTPLSSVFLFPPRGGVTIRWSLNSPRF